MLRVPYKELDAHPDEGVRCNLRGQAFTGVAFKPGPNGQVRAEWTFRDGLQWGPQRTWYESGQLVSAAYAVAGFAHGVIRHWWPDGEKSAVEYVQYGVTLRAKDWDRQGRVVRDYTVESEEGVDWYLAQMERRKAEFGALVAAEPIPEEFLRATEEDWK